MRRRYEEDYNKGLTSDMIRIVGIEKKLKILSDELIADPSLWTSVITVGLTRMFESSDFPILPDRILELGFAPHEWFILVSKASHRLGYSISKTIMNTNDLNLVKLKELLETSINQNTEHISNETFERITKVLKWNDALNQFNEKGVKALSFLWLADYLSTFEIILFPETDIVLQKKTWTLLTKLIEEDQETIVELVDSIIDSLGNIKIITGISEVEITNWSEVIRFPW